MGRAFTEAGEDTAEDLDFNQLEVMLRGAENVELTSIWWAVGFGVLALVLLVLAFKLRPRKWLFLMVPLIIVTLLISIALVINAQFMYVKTVGALVGLSPYDTASEDQLRNPQGNPSRGAVVNTTIPGTVSGVGTWSAVVYLPPEYFTDRDRSFPVIYLLHGVPGVAVPGLSDDAGPIGFFDGISVDNAAQVAGSQGHPVILVAPVVSPTSADTECVDGTLGNWQTYLTVDVVNWVAQFPRFQTGAGSTALSGYSMGGTCAQVTALRNPELAGVVGNMSGASTVDAPGGAAALFGANRVQELANYDSIKLVQTNPATHGITMWLEVGASDGQDLIQSQRDFAQAARAEGMTVVAKEVPGGHDFGVWTKAYADWLPWAASILYGQTPPEPK